MQEEDAVLQELAAKLQDKVAIMQNYTSSANHDSSPKSTDNISQSIDSHAIMQHQNSPKETLNKNKENIEKLNDASHQNFSYKNPITVQDLIQRCCPNPITKPKGCCIRCGKTGISDSAQEYWNKKLGVVMCFHCGTPIKKEAEKLRLIK